MFNCHNKVSIPILIDGIFMKKISIKVPLGDKRSNLWGFHFRIPEEVAIKFKNGKDRRIIATFNNQIKNHCAIMPSHEGPFIMLNKQLVQQLNIEEGDLVAIQIEKDNSEFGMPICEEFEAVILGDKEVFNHFKRLTPGKQRNLIHLVNKIKSPDIKMIRSMAIAHHLMEAKGKLEFKQLNNTIKEFNQRNNLT